MEAGWIPEFGDKHGRGVVADPGDGGQELADLVLLEPGGDIAIEPLKPLAQSLEILASIAYAGLMGRPGVCTRGREKPQPWDTGAG